MYSFKDFWHPKYLLITQELPEEKRIMNTRWACISFWDSSSFIIMIISTHLLKFNAECHSCCYTKLVYTYIYYRFLGHSPKTGYIADIAVKTNFFKTFKRTTYYCLVVAARYSRAECSIAKFASSDTKCSWSFWNFSFMKLQNSWI